MEVTGEGYSELYLASCMYFAEFIFIRIRGAIKLDFLLKMA